MRQQHASRQGEWEPFVSAICCPFEPQAEDAASILNFIHISHPAESTPDSLENHLVAGCTAFILEVRAGPSWLLATDGPKGCKAESCRRVLETCAKASTCVVVASLKSVVKLRSCVWAEYESRPHFV